jgi:hypothetical protein
MAKLCSSSHVVLNVQEFRVNTKEREFGERSVNNVKYWTHEFSPDLAVMAWTQFGSKSENTIPVHEDGSMGVNGGLFIAQSGLKPVRVGNIECTPFSPGFCAWSKRCWVTEVGENCTGSR